MLLIISLSFLVCFKEEKKIVFGVKNLGFMPNRPALEFMYELL